MTIVKDGGSVMCLFFYFWQGLYFRCVVGVLALHFYLSFF